MKFKVGDMVRLTRDAILEKVKSDFIIEEELVRGVVIIDTKDPRVWYEDFLLNKRMVHEDLIELVPEEPEFVFGEEIEVSDDGEEWEKRIYLATVGVERKLYGCVSATSIERYKSGFPYNAAFWEYARKLRPQLTRKEIAEKFGVSEDFTLVD